MEYGCAECGLKVNRKPSQVRGRVFCSRSCAARLNNRIHPKRRPQRQSKDCLRCGLEFLVPWQSRRLYCSSTCRFAEQREVNLRRWLTGAWDGTTKRGLAPAIRAHLIEECGSKCQKCNWSEVHPVTGNVPLEVNHIDGDCTNNHADNLEVLCPNCHALTPTYRSLNRGRSTRYRKLER